MALREIIEPFIVGPGGRRMSPEEVARQREIASALMESGSDYSPVGHWLQGAARLANAGVGAFQNWQLDREEQAGRDNYAANSFLTRPGGALASGGDTSGVAAALAGPSGGGMDAYRNAIASIESAGSGDYGAIGPTNENLGRALGKYQIMEANIGPWSQEALGRQVSPDEFMASPQLQDAIFDHRFGQYVNQFGPEGAAQAWFAGPGGVGQMGRQDVLGTSVSAYTDKFNNALGPPQQGDANQAIAQALAPQGGTVPPQGGMSPSMQEIAQVLGDPWAPSEHKDIARLLYGQMVQQQDPRYQQQLRAGDLGIQKSEFELNQMLNPGPAKPEYGFEFAPDGTLIRTDKTSGGFDPMGQFAKPADPSFRQLSPQEAQQANLDPGKSWQVGPDNRVYEIGGGGVNVSVGDEGQRMGTIPAGMAAVPDPSNPSGFRLEAIPGGPAAQEAAAAGAKADAAGGARDTVTDTITGQAQKARDLIGGFTTGVGGWAMSRLPWSDAADLNRYVGSLKSIAAAENLQAMRAASPTGGALGNASDADIKLLQDKAGAMDPNSQRFPEQLDDYERTLLRIVHGPVAGDEIYEQTRTGGAGQSQADPGIDALLEKYQ